MKLVSIIIALLVTICASNSAARDTISVQYVSEHTYEFSIHDGALSGPGAEFLKAEFALSQFVLLGELHGDKGISEFTAAIIPELAAVGYSYLGLEVGPASFESIRPLLVSGSVQNNLNQFYSDYYKELGDIPIPFIDSKEDVPFLEAALADKFRILALDQEFYSSTLLLLNRIVELQPAAANTSQYKAAISYVKEQHKKDDEDEDYELHEHLTNSAELADFFATLDRSPQIEEIITALQTSWDIYQLYSTNIAANLDKRANLMKRLFATQYKEAAKEGSLPKMLIKMGGWHTMRGITYNAVYDIGNQVHELASFNGTKDLNIAFMHRYVMDDEEPEGYYDNSVGDSGWLTEHRPLLEQGQKDKWVAIDLRSMKEDIINRDIWAYPAIKNKMYDVDLILIPPMANEMTPNYDIK